MPATKKSRVTRNIRRTNTDKSGRFPFPPIPWSCDMWNNPTPAPNCIIVYEDRGGYGDCQSFNGQGGKVYDSGAFHDIANDSISSLRIAANTLVVLCEHANGSGASAAFGPFSSQTDIDYVGDAMNDRTSRIEIYPRRAGSQWLVAARASTRAAKRPAK